MNNCRVATINNCVAINSVYYGSNAIEHCRNCGKMKKGGVFTARRVCIALIILWQDVCLSVRRSICLSVTNG